MSTVASLHVLYARRELENSAATKIQRMVRAAKGQELFQVVLQENRKNKVFIRFQARCRGVVCRLRIARKKEFDKRVYEVTPMFSVFKAIWHGRHTRLLRREVCMPCALRGRCALGRPSCGATSLLAAAGGTDAPARCTALGGRGDRCDSLPAHFPCTDTHTMVRSLDLHVVTCCEAPPCPQSPAT